MTTYYNKNLSEPFNQTIPLSQRTSGAELDECCEGGMAVKDMTEMAGGNLPQAEAGMGMDTVIRKLKK